MSQLTDKSLDVTDEEGIEFELLERRLASLNSPARDSEISRMVAVAGECRTTSLTGICTALFNAGCSFNTVDSNNNK
ncbi:hypothetical protein [Shewanella sp. Isolate11]|uniref:hypothetical protein n=1 Tax=Shewanella sp. Isolate11 TaxID=2908530 RepID=UPI001EFD494F|nr:hypothetical protein [Shewanella sp. Isolate11]MCG9697447.1 hypothetical protein [Shewanella sp. Isolate11]